MYSVVELQHPLHISVREEPPLLPQPPLPVPVFQGLPTLSILPAGAPIGLRHCHHAMAVGTPSARPPGEGGGRGYKQDGACCTAWEAVCQHGWLCWRCGTHQHLSVHACACACAHACAQACGYAQACAYAHMCEFPCANVHVRTWMGMSEGHTARDVWGLGPQQCIR